MRRVTEGRSRLFEQTSVPAAYARFMGTQLFGPWARELVGRAGVPVGASVLDVACGPGTVTRVAAAAAGAGGRVRGSDISAPMLAVASSVAAEPGAAQVEYVEGSATSLGFPGESFDIVLCQQGLQFFDDRAAAVREFRRVLKPGGIAAASVWAAERPLGLFGAIGATLREYGLAEPYPRAFDAASYALPADQLRELLGSGGFSDVSVETVELDCVWETADDAIATISGTPFGPLVAALPVADQDAVRASLAERLGCNVPGQVTIRTAANIARGVA